MEAVELGISLTLTKLNLGELQAVIYQQNLRLKLQRNIHQSGKSNFK